MAIVKNKTSRQFNCRALAHNGARLTLRLIPGMNDVEDDVWQHFVSKDGKKINSFIAELKSRDQIDYGEHLNILELEVEHKAIHKSAPKPTE